MQIIGIKKDSEHYSIASLSKEGSEIRIHFIETVNSSTALKEILSKKEHVLVAGLPSSQVLLRSFVSLIKKKALLRKTLPFKQREIFPFDPKEGVSKTIISPQGKGFFVRIFSSQKAQVKKHLLSYEDLRLDVLSIEPMALLRFALFLEQKESDFLVVHFDRHKTLLLAVENRRVKQYVTLDMGAVELKKHLVGPLEKKLTLKECIDKGSKEFVELFGKKIDRALYFLFQKRESLKGQKVLFTGFCEMYPVEEMFLLGREELFSPLVVGNRRGFHASSILSHALSIGLCLDVIQDDEKSCQLLDKEFFPAHHRDHFVKKLKKHALVCLGLLVASYLLFFSYVKKEDIRKSTRLDTLFEEFGAVYPLFFQGLNEESVEEKLDFSSRLITKKKLEKSPFVAVPKVKNLLIYLQQSKHLKILENSQDFALKKLDYQLMQRPTFLKPGEPYLVKVDMVFNTALPEQAKAFYAEISQDSVHIDLKKPITFNQRKNAYALSFFFKE
ncbi:hypothetical protein COB21_03385 [Candidatus Aerophobetes bacterium]|uniref:GspL cytoplasmic actin-ATPase-like domain-containing protein n=1 Tax=Aerophobetes bacterium TaxID=2030807 RepID=A0A2A4X4Y5_UNCAE|nr:MAG: hypothetical protein COB21_03385 [Candidatus Aerophobetes bacterium]